MISKYIKENKIFASLASIWLLINFVWWSMPDEKTHDIYMRKSSKQFFFPENGKESWQKYSITERWDLTEVLAYGIGAILLYVFLQVVFKAIISKVKKAD
jgi:hypothetical protein